MWNYKLTKEQFVRHDIIIVIIIIIISSFWAKNLLLSLVKYNLDRLNCKL